MIFLLLIFLANPSPQTDIKQIYNLAIDNVIDYNDYTYVYGTNRFIQMFSLEEEIPELDTTFEVDNWAPISVMEKFKKTYGSLYDSLISINHSRDSLTPYFLDTMFIDTEVHHKINNTEEAWNNPNYTYTKFNFIALSNIAFNKNLNKALLYISHRTAIKAEGSLMYFIKKNGKWSIVKKHILWMA